MIPRLPSSFISIKQWINAGFYTVYHKIPELTHLAAFRIVRNFRKTRSSNELLCSLEQYFLQRAQIHYHRWGHAFCSLFGVQVQVETRLQNDISPTDRILYVQLNQHSMIEQPLLALISSDLTKCSQCSKHSKEKRFLSTYFTLVNFEFSLLPFWGWNPALIGVTIQRGNKTSTRRGLQDILERIHKYNDRFFMSIEGKRNPYGQLSPYKMGAAIIAIQTQSDIVPITFENAHQIWPYGHWQIRPGQIKIVVHDRVSIKDFTLNDKESLTQKLRTLAEKELKFNLNKQPVLQ